jgi:hypothetical protein
MRCGTNFVANIDGELKIFTVINVGSKYVKVRERWAGSYKKIRMTIREYDRISHGHINYVTIARYRREHPITKLQLFWNLLCCRDLKYWEYVQLGY